jgi:hypothetical protein
MARERQSVSDTIGWLSFTRQAYPNFYFQEQRIRDRFHGYLGSIREFSESVEKSGEAAASVKPLFFEAGFRGGLGRSVEVQWDLGDRLAQALILRAYLTTAGELDTHARSAPVTDFVLARGRGRIVQAEHVADSPLWQESGISPDVVTEIAAEQHRQAEYRTTADPQPLYWATYANTDGGLVVSLLGDASVNGSDVRNWGGLDNVNIHPACAV